MPDVGVFVLTREADPSRPDGRCAASSRARSPSSASTTRSRRADRSRTPTGIRRCCEAAAAAVAEFRPDVAHVHHLTCLSTDLVRHLSDAGVPVVLTLNDYWLLCHRGQLVDRDGRRLRGPVSGACGRCVPADALLGSGAYRGARLLRAVPGAAAVLGAASRIVNATAPDDGSVATARRLSHMREVAGGLRPDPRAVPYAWPGGSPRAACRPGACNECSLGIRLRASRASRSRSRLAAAAGVRRIVPAHQGAASPD